MTTTREVIRIWTDEMYRRLLQAETKEYLPPNPAGQLESVDSDLRLLEQIDIDGVQMEMCTAGTGSSRCCW
jgi:mersacidin/lichenicidin family type 2 lantibiotic